MWQRSMHLFYVVSGVKRYAACSRHTSSHQTEQVTKLCAFCQNELIGVIPFCYVMSMHFCIATVRGNG
jgi:hypothetical protein